MSLVADIVGVLLIGGAIATLLQRRSRWSTVAPGVAVTVVVLAGVNLFQTGWSLVSSFAAANRINRSLSASAAEVAAAPGVHTAFLAWARSVIVDAHAAPTYWLLPELRLTDPLAYQWSSYQLLPAQQVESLRDANWIVFYNFSPAKIAYPRSVFPRLVVYSPGFALAERARVR